jgi:hypothetical protein
MSSFCELLARKVLCKRPSFRVLVGWECSAETGAGAAPEQSKNRNCVKRANCANF